jgi:hypothetical protein
MAQVLRESEQQRVTHVQLRGDFLSPGAEVQPGTPAVLPALESGGSRPTRFDLARWLVSPKHPLTSRVAVNRTWQHLFGRGIVSTENDFGTQGAAPSHSDLLDWLSVWFQHGWSQKRLIREIVTSAAYRRSSLQSDELADRDPDNTLLARQSRVRHEAEILRDAALAVAGVLDDQVGGPSFRPAVPPDAGNVVELRWTSAPTPDRYRRGLYIVVQRNVQLPFLMTFDAPDGNTFCTRRERSNTPPQALTLLNDPFFFECATRLGRRLTLEATTDATRIELAFRIGLSRPPSKDDIRDFTAFLQGQRAVLEHEPERVAALGEGALPGDATDVALWTCAARILMNTDEFVTRD